MGALATGFMMRGVSAGLNDARRIINEDEDRDFNRKAREVQLESAQVGLDDAKHRRDRQSVTEEREDEAYAIQQKARAFQEALGVFATSNGQNTQPLIDTYNQHSPDGGQIKGIKRNSDGTYETTLVTADGETKTLKQTYDDIGATATMLTDPAMYWKMHRESQAKKGDRSFEMKKMEREYELKAELERIKEGKKGKGSETNRKLENDMDKRAARGRGSLNGDMMELTGINRSLASYDAFIGTKLVEEHDLGTNEAYMKASRIVDRIRSTVEQRVKEETDDPREQEALKEKYMEAMVVQTAQKLKGKSADTKKAGATGANTATIPDGAIKKLKANPNMAKDFDAKYGKGEAEKILGKTQAGLKEPEKKKPAAGLKEPAKTNTKASRIKAITDEISDIESELESDTKVKSGGISGIGQRALKEKQFPMGMAGKKQLENRLKELKQELSALDTEQVAVVK